MLIYYFTTFRGTRKICRKHSLYIHFKPLITASTANFYSEIFFSSLSTQLYSFTWLVFSWRWCGFDRRGLVSLAYLHVCGPSSFNLFVWFCRVACLHFMRYAYYLSLPNKMQNNIFMSIIYFLIISQETTTPPLLIKWFIYWNANPCVCALYLMQRNKLL